MRQFFLYTFVGIAAVAVVMNADKFAALTGVLGSAFDTTSADIIGSSGQLNFGPIEPRPIGR